VLARACAREPFGGDACKVTLACDSKRGRDDCQTIRRLIQESRLTEPGRPAPLVPARTAQLLRHDFKAAGIPNLDAQGRVADFHALRHSSITGLGRSGVIPPIVRKLARHSTITLTLDRLLG
jgi:hypothetical protein